MMVIIENENVVSESGRGRGEERRARVGAEIITQLS